MIANEDGTPILTPIIETLEALDEGNLLDRLTEAQFRVVHAVDQLHQKGHIALKLTYQRTPQGRIRVAVEVNEKVPQSPPGDAQFFVEDGRLSRKMPGQGELVFAEQQPEPDGEDDDNRNGLRSV